MYFNQVMEYPTVKWYEEALHKEEISVRELKEKFQAKILESKVSDLEITVTNVLYMSNLTASHRSYTVLTRPVYSGGMKHVGLRCSHIQRLNVGPLYTTGLKSLGLT